jgi:hypothetical protein
MKPSPEGRKLLAQFETYVRQRMDEVGYEQACKDVDDSLQTLIRRKGRLPPEGMLEAIHHIMSELRREIQ